MSASQIVAVVFLGLGVLVMWLSSVGVWAMGTVFDRLHYLGPASTFGTLLLGVALVISTGASTDGWKGLFAMLLFAVVSPLSTHAIALAARTRTFGGFTILHDEEKRP